MTPRSRWRAAAAGGAIVLAAATGVGTNLITDDFSWGLAVGVVMLVLAAVALAVVTSLAEKHGSPSPEDGGDTSRPVGAALSAHSGNAAGRDVRFGVPPAYVALFLVIIAGAVLATMMRLAPASGPASIATGDDQVNSATGLGEGADDQGAPKCADPTGGVKATPEVAGGLVFCPTSVDGGRGRITGPFDLRGQVLGAPELRADLVLLVRIDPSTCDANGKRGAPGRFLLDVDFGAAASGSWFHHDDLGGQQSGVTLGRIFEFAQASPAAVRALKEDRGEWLENGILDLPAGISVLSEFTVPPGESAGSVPCER